MKSILGIAILLLLIISIANSQSPTPVHSSTTFEQKVQKIGNEFRATTDNYFDNLQKRDAEHRHQCWLSKAKYCW